MDKQGYYRLAITGAVEEILLDNKSIKLNNDGDIVEITMPKTNISKVVCGQEIDVYIKFKSDFDNDIKIYGYLTKAEREFLAQFENRISGTCVGPLGAINMYDSCIDYGMTMKDICFEISVGNYELLHEAGHIALRLAQKLCDGLKDSIVCNESSVKDHEDHRVVEAVKTIKSLGFVESEINNALEKIDINDQMQTMDIVQATIERIQNM